jgi:hypothetical protein
VQIRLDQSGAQCKGKTKSKRRRAVQIDHAQGEPCVTEVIECAARERGLRIREEEDQHYN